MDKPSDLAEMEPLDWIPSVFLPMFARDDSGQLWTIEGTQWVPVDERALIHRDEHG